MQISLQERIPTTAIAFRGYNTTNLGRSAELLNDPAYGPVVVRILNHVSEISSEIMGRSIDLKQRIRNEEETNLETFADAIALIMGMEMVQVELLREFFDISLEKAPLSMGYSLGEITALVHAGVVDLQEALLIPLSMADQCVELAKDTTMGVVFSRGKQIDVPSVQRIMNHINEQGCGVIAISSFLSPNSILVLGQETTVNRFRKQVKTHFEGDVHVRKNKDHWPPMHTPVLWQKAIPNRAAHMLHTIAVNTHPPKPAVISLAQPAAYYNDHNTRNLLGNWTDHPQHLWDAVYEILRRGMETVIHVGPAPNLVPATFRRLGDNIRSQLSRRTLNGIGMRAMSGMVRRPWLNALLPNKAALLRAPFVEQIILEDWLLENSPSGKGEGAGF